MPDTSIETLMFLDLRSNGTTSEPISTPAVDWGVMTSCCPNREKSWKIELPRPDRLTPVGDEVRVEEAVAPGQRRPHAELVDPPPDAMVARGIAAGDVAAKGLRPPDGEPALARDDPVGHVGPLLLIEDPVLDPHVKLVEPASLRPLEDEIRPRAGELPKRSGGARRVEAIPWDDGVADRGGVVLVRARRVRLVAEDAVVHALIEGVEARVPDDDRHRQVHRQVVPQPDLEGGRDRVAELFVDQVLDQSVLRVSDGTRVPLAQDGRALVHEVVADPEVDIEDVVVFERGRDSGHLGAHVHVAALVRERSAAAAAAGVCAAVAPEAETGAGARLAALVLAGAIRCRGRGRESESQPERQEEGRLPHCVHPGCPSAVVGVGALKTAARDAKSYQRSGDPVKQADWARAERGCGPIPQRRAFSPDRRHRPWSAVPAPSSWTAGCGG